ncbi:MAG TPA: FtsX-like permease family protein, partial [Pseudohaliea sp.]|nr:FtsX-like permease family protein [Pseudohaliea sp.]
MKAPVPANPALARSALRLLRRDWRGGELGVLVAALILAVAVVTGISAFTGRLQGALAQESHRFLAADLVVRGSQPLPDAWLAEARGRGLRTARVLTFTSMVAAGGETMALGAVKAVSGAYPLRGELTASGEPFGSATLRPGGPARGTLWLDSRLFALLDLAPGASVEIGEAAFTVAAAVRTEPDRGTSFLGLGPRVLMHVDDIPATGVVQPGSRVAYRQLYAGEPGPLGNFRRWLEGQLEPGQRIEAVEDGQPGVASALERAERFLLLAGSLGVLLAAVAIALASRRFCSRHADYVAIMKSLGATTAYTGRLYGGSFALLGLAATAAGCLAGGLLQGLAFDLLAARLPFDPGPAGLRPWLMGGVTALVCLGFFAWPPLWRLAAASPLRVLRRDLPLDSGRGLADYALGLAAVSGLMWWYSGDAALTGAVLAGLTLTVALGGGAAVLLLRGGRLAGMRAGSIWRLALASLQRRGAGNALQVVMFAIAIMLLLLLTLVRSSLIDSWQAQLPPEAPDHFMLNIAPEEVAAVEQRLRADGIAAEGLYPMIRGRIMAVNEAPLPADEEGEGPRQREANFTWSATPPSGNELVAGRWWAADSGEALVSLEEEFAERLGAGLGDRLELRVGARPLTVTV